MTMESTWHRGRILLLLALMLAVAGASVGYGQMMPGMEPAKEEDAAERHSGVPVELSVCLPVTGLEAARSPTGSIR